MRRIAGLTLTELLTLGAASAQAFSLGQVLRGGPADAASVSTRLFADLERSSRLVDITYCVSTTGLSKPFKCISHCNEFPSLFLVTTWNTGALLSDSCGYIAIDHGTAPNELVQDHGTIIVAFRGTYSISNTIIDLSTIPQAYVPYPSPDNGGKPPESWAHECNNCTAHMGFLESWRQARELVLPEVKALKLRYPHYRIHLVGHSLGGAIASLAALEMKLSLGWDDIMVTTFGEPRVGNRNFNHYLDKAFDLIGAGNPEQRAYRRVTHADDPVPLLPPTEMGYSSHAGEIHIFKKDLPPTEEDLRFCVGDRDPACSAGGDREIRDVYRRLPNFDTSRGASDEDMESLDFPTRLKLWQLLFAHRDYFWRLGVCLPGGDPADWGRRPDSFKSDEL